MRIDRSAIECAIFTRDKNYAYNVRNRLGIIGLKVGYLNTMFDLLTFVLHNKSAVVAVDARATMLIKFIDEFAHCQCSKNFCFIYLDDHKSVNIKCDDKVTFCSRFSNILEDVPQVLAQVRVNSGKTCDIPDYFVDHSITVLFKSFKFDQKHIGYKFLHAVVKGWMGCTGKSYTILKDVYRDVAKEYGKCPENVEKSIRLAISKSKEKNPELYKSIFKDNKVSNSVFINFIVEKIKYMFACAPQVFG